MFATIVLRLGSAVTIGCLQWLLAALARRNMPELQRLTIAQGSAVMMLVGILQDHLWSSSHVWPVSGLLLFLGGGGSAVGYVCVFRAMEEGPVSLVAPVAGAAGGVAALIAITTGYDTLTWMHPLISLLLFGGILLCLVQPSEQDTWVALASGKSTLLPIGLLYAIGSWATDFTLQPVRMSVFRGKEWRKCTPYLVQNTRLKDHRKSRLLFAPLVSVACLLS